ncbi:unnamed protein product, partial [Rotaria sp. Silwood2]
NEEHDGHTLHSNRTHSIIKNNIQRTSDDNQLQEDQINIHQHYDEQSNSSLNNEKLHNSKNIQSVITNPIDNQHDYVIIENNQILSNEMQNKQLISINRLKNDQTIDKSQYNRSISLNPAYSQSQEDKLHRRNSLTINLQNVRDESKESIHNKTIIKHIEENNLLSIESTNNNKLNIEQTKSDDYSPV